MTTLTFLTVLAAYWGLLYFFHKTHRAKLVLQTKCLQLQTESTHRLTLIILLKAEVEGLEIRINHLCNELRSKTYTKGGSGLDKAFSQQEIKDLVFLCHPDKHGNNDRSARLTKKLLAMRK